MVALAARLGDRGWAPELIARKVRSGKLLVRSMNISTSWDRGPDGMLRQGLMSHFELHVGDGRMLRFSMPTVLVTTEFLWSFVGEPLAHPISTVRLRCLPQSSTSQDVTLAERATRARHGGRSLASRWHEWTSSRPTEAGAAGSPGSFATFLTLAFCVMALLVLCGGC